MKKFPGVKLLQLKDEQINSFKKKAVDTGINTATGDLIVTTDADCLPGTDWLNTIVSFKETNGAKFIVAPVTINNGSPLVEVFQSMDFMILQGITGASVYKKIHAMCNGANLAYDRSLYFDVDGFNGIDHIASGDDMLLMGKVKEKYPGSIQYVKSKDAIVSTQPMGTWTDFIRQRIRWASKSAYYNDRKITAVLLLVYLFNLSFVVLFFVSLFWPVYWFWLVGLVVIKTLVELPLLYSVASFFGKQKLIKYFFFLQPLHIVYTVGADFWDNLVATPGKAEG